ncbi:hypothetical protein BCR43DRAFT_523976 [Syncephalastrum racemosum]|uniref:Protein SCAI n=1 Tax=Syncephalastrum racemosum TaxID=13706 RepID=A0A1X2HG36_SYNRA|nr:hypothetical protein BCR43DRAFT_523976 [Syncephalastrum racemosum]
MNKDSPTLYNSYNPVDDHHPPLEGSNSSSAPGQHSPHPSVTHLVDDPQTQQTLPPTNQPQQQLQQLLPSVVEPTPTAATSASTSASNTNLANANPALSAAATTSATGAAPAAAPATATGPSTATATAAVAAAAAAAATDERALQNQKLVEEFQYLLEKSQSLFSGLRDLPPTGSHRQWRPYFEKTFEIYTKLWKFQQLHRPVLEDKENYGLKRWEVGEIASKIGQLYYHYYLRTSDTSYLWESYVFYDAIHERQYFKDILEAKNPALMIKKIRYYARFIVVSLLLNKDDKIRQLVSELEELVDDYTKAFKPPDAKEWQIVVNEISTFMEAEKKLAPISPEKLLMTVDYRLPITTQNDVPGRLRLQEAILVGSCQKQIKFSELTLDMYRMLQSLEKQLPASDLPQKTVNIRNQEDAGKNRQEAVMAKNESTTTKNSAAAETKQTTSQPQQLPQPQQQPQSQQQQLVQQQHRRVNPHKYLLYRPSLSQLMVYIATACKDTTENGVILLYLSADGCEYPDVSVPGFQGGVATAYQPRKGAAADSAPSGAAAATSTSTATAASTTSGAGPVAGNNANATSSGSSNAIQSNNPTTSALQPRNHCLHPADLVPFTRKPLFLIVDSSSSVIFAEIPNVFDQPLISLLSPIEYPSSVQDRGEIGSLFTLFLHAPLLGFCSVSDIGNLDQDKWDESVLLMSKMETHIASLLLEDPDVVPHWKKCMSDEFLKAFMVRFTLCGIILRCHSSFKDEKNYPTSSPALPESVYGSTEIIHMLYDLTLITRVSTYFSFPASIVPPETFVSHDNQTAVEAN